MIFMPRLLQVKEMINPNDSIRYTNVISRKYHFHYKEFEEITKDFLNHVVALGSTIKGPLFYSINNVPHDEMVLAEFFVPIEEEALALEDGLYFHSYFSIEDMISVCLFDNFESKTELAYALLFEYMGKNNLEQVTPIFHVVSGDETLQYVFIKIGVTNQTKK